MKTSRSSSFLAGLTAVTFTLGTILTSAQVLAQNTPTANNLITLSPAFVPPVLKGITINPKNPFQFDFIVDSGQSELDPENLKVEAEKLIRYFLTSMTIPEKDLWVNLSPLEKDRIVEVEFGKTEMGKTLLDQDYILKQLSASLIYPEKDLGKLFWDKIKQKAFERYGTNDIPIDTFHKVWIVPASANVYEHQNTVVVLDSRLKVMLENDYLSISQKSNEAQSEDFNTLSSQIYKEIVIPEIEKEVNEGKNFAPLRQIYNSMILATWYKRKLINSPLTRIYADQKKMGGVEMEDKDAVERIYNQYLEAFRTGVYNYIKEEYDPETQQVLPKKYFSGGVNLDAAAISEESTAPRNPLAVGQYTVFSTETNPITDGAMLSEVVIDGLPENVKVQKYKHPNSPFTLIFIRAMSPNPEEGKPTNLLFVYHHQFSALWFEFNDFPKSDDEIKKIMAVIIYLRQNLKHKLGDTVSIEDHVRRLEAEIKPFIGQLGVSNEPENYIFNAEKMRREIIKNKELLAGMFANPLPTDTRNVARKARLLVENSLFEKQIKDLDRPTDGAMNAAPGGIDLNSMWLNLKSQGNGVHFEIPADFTLTPNNFPINGVVPVIYRIQTLPSLSPLLGASTPEEQPSIVKN